MGLKDLFNNLFNKNNSDSSPSQNTEKNPVDNDRYANGTMNVDQYTECRELQSRDNVVYNNIEPSDQPVAITPSANIHEVDLFGADRDQFWNHHGNTKEDYMELASHIPEVKERLEAGENLEDLYNDPDIGACARNYFDPNNIPKVIQYKDTFISQGDNRHRILAAQELGYDIPVRIVGTYSPIDGEKTDIKEQDPLYHEHTDGDVIEDEIIDDELIDDEAPTDEETVADDIILPPVEEAAVEDELIGIPAVSEIVYDADEGEIEIPTEPRAYSPPEYFDQESVSDEELAYLDENTGENELIQSRLDENGREMSPLQDQEMTGGTYFPDAWQFNDLPKGTTLYQLSGPEGTGSKYYTDAETVNACRNDKGEVDIAKLKEVLQINDPTNYKTELNEYTVTEDMRVPAADCKANYWNGDGGGRQYYLNLENKNKLELAVPPPDNGDPVDSDDSPDVPSSNDDDIPPNDPPSPDGGEMSADDKNNIEEDNESEKTVENTDESELSDKQDNAEPNRSRSMHDDLNNPDLFKENEQGDYTYSENEFGKNASGSLELNKGERDAKAQREVGGDDRRATDDGGHLIGTRFGGDGGTENLEAQDRNLNRGSFKIRENEWASQLENGDKVFVNTESYRSNDSERPGAFMGYTVVEHPDGTREWDAFSYQNESAAVQKAQNEELAEQNDLMDEYDNPIDYDPAEYEAELSDEDYEVVKDTPCSHNEEAPLQIESQTDASQDNDTTEFMEDESEPTDDEAEPADDESEPAEDESEPTEDEAEPADDEPEPTEDKADPVEDEANPAEDEAEPVDDEVEPVDDESEPAENEVEPVDDEAEPADDGSEPTEDEADPEEDESEPTEDEAEPAEDESEPTEDEAEPADDESEPTEDESEPTDDEAEPADDESEPTEDEAESTEDEAAPADDESEPAEDEADPADDEPEPAENEVEPVDDEAEPADDGSEPTEDESEPTEDEADPAEDESEPTEDEAEPTEDELEPAEDESEPMEDESEPTEDEADPAEDESEPTEDEPEPAEDEAEPVDDEVEPVDDESEPTEDEAEPATDEISEFDSISEDANESSEGDEDGNFDMEDTDDITDIDDELSDFDDLSNEDADTIDDVSENEGDAVDDTSDISDFDDNTENVEYTVDSDASDAADTEEVDMSESDFDSYETDADMDAITSETAETDSGEMLDENIEVPESGEVDSEFDDDSSENVKDYGFDDDEIVEAADNDNEFDDTSTDTAMDTASESPDISAAIDSSENIT
ncbi:MAG: DNA/RNA non-specific endonuclease [Clostridia bacterium]|nr:DNA/RNA non-specific endonuclease [Clostridia bacterium]